VESYAPPAALDADRALLSRAAVVAAIAINCMTKPASGVPYRVGPDSGGDGATDWLVSGAAVDLRSERTF